jgi:hypothetical protein
LLSAEKAESKKTTSLRELFNLNFGFIEVLFTLARVLAMQWLSAFGGFICRRFGGK